MKILTSEFSTFYFLFWWAMCILYKEGDYNLSKVLNNSHLWLISHKKARLTLWLSFELTCLSLIALAFWLNCHWFDALIYFTALGGVLIAFNKVQKLGLCKFCMESHTATLGAIGYSCYWLDPNYLYWGFLCASINGWLRTFINR